MEIHWALLFAALLYTTESYPKFYTIEIDDGRIRGKLNETIIDKNQFYSFRGIPFAKPPINELRFRVTK